MKEDLKVRAFLSQYDERIFANALKLREILLVNLPNVIEQVDISAKMIAYCYGQKYEEMICTIIPSKKGLKVGFYKGKDLPDPQKLLKGTGKISRYVEIESDEQITSVALKKLIADAFKAYEHRMTGKNKF